MDEGWTRWIFEPHAIPYTSLTDSAAKAGRLRDQFDVVLVPDMSLRDIRNGVSAAAVPPPHACGLGQAGLTGIRQFVEEGGTLVLLDHAAGLGTSELGVPVNPTRVPTRSDYDGDATGASGGTQRMEPLYAPGSVPRVLQAVVQRAARGGNLGAAVITTNARFPEVQRMRIVRKFGYSLLLAAVPAVASAQQAATTSSSFENAWYWGAKGGIASFDPDGSGRVTATSVGGEWLITRSRAGLYLSLDHSFFDEVSSIYDPTVSGSLRSVDISDMRRYAFGLLAFPLDWGALRPYAGIGLSINVIQDATPRGSFVSDTALMDVAVQLNEQSSRISPVFTAGLQINAGRVALFGQASAMPTRRNFLIYGAERTYLLEGGLRFNLAKAIEPLR
jgi:hypothetical protein